MKNNFDALRLGLAWMVVAVHAFQISDQPELFVLWDFFSSSFAVKGFFAVSGYLVCKSYQNSQSLNDFFSRRMLRVVPAYFAIIFVTFGLGIGLTELSLAEFFGNQATWRYLGANLLFLNFLQPSLPEVLQGAILNPALWTIKIELCLYVVTPLVVAAFLRLGPSRAIVLIYFLSVCWYVGFQSIGGDGNIWKELSRQFPGQLAYYATGGYLALYPPSKRVHGWIAIFSTVCFFLTKGTIYQSLIEPAFVAFLVTYIAVYLPFHVNLGNIGDISYGTYLYHSIVIHLIVASGLYKLSPWLALLCTCIAVFLLAFASWHGLEKRLLRRGKSSGEKRVRAEAPPPRTY